MSDVNSRQVDGKHYRSKIQHWDFVEANGLGYLEGCATKYIARHRKKHPSPIVDLEKAEHYVEKLRDLYLSGVRNNRVTLPLKISVEKFALANELISKEIEIIHALTIWGKIEDLDFALHGIRFLLRWAKNWEGD